MSWFEEHSIDLISILNPFKKVSGIEVFIFGSALTKTNPQDLDILIIYPDDISSVDLDLLREMKSKILFCEKIDIHYLVLSKKETGNNPHLLILNNILISKTKLF